MTAASYETCARWATVEDVSGECCKGGFTDTALADDAAAAASTILYHLSGRRWPGECTDTIRPTADHASVPNFAPYAGDGIGPLWGMCGCTGVYGCSAVSEVYLPGFPVTSIEEVVVDGVELAPTAYRILDRSRLVAVPGSGFSGWPCCQDLTLDTTEEGTWSVTYKWGSAPPRAGVRAAASLLCELYRGWTRHPDGCALPERVTTVVRQGVTVALLDNFAIFQEGLTGIGSIDLWLTSLRVGKSEGTSAVFVPDQLPPYRRDNP